MTIGNDTPKLQKDATFLRKQERRSPRRSQSSQKNRIPCQARNVTNGID